MILAYHRFFFRLDVGFSKDLLQDGTGGSEVLFGGDQPIFWDDHRGLSHHLVLRRGLLLKGVWG